MTLEEIFKSIQDKSAVLVDVREDAERIEENDLNAIHYPYSLFLQDKGHEQLPQKKKLLLFCRSGTRAKKMIHVLEQYGFVSEALLYTADDLQLFFSGRAP